MSIKNIKELQIGTVGFPISQWLIETDDTLSEVTATGYLNGFKSTYSFGTKDFAIVYTTDYKDLYMQILVSSDYQDVSLVNPYEQIGSGVSYSGALVSGDFAVYDGTTGIIKDLGYLPTDATKTKVVMASAAVVANHIACFSDVSGTVNDDSATAINGGNLQAGLSGTAGYLASFPGTASKGSLRLTAVANTGDTLTTISNVAMGQASVISIPDPVAATANFVVAPAALVSGNMVKASGTAGLIIDAGFQFKGDTTATYAGGGTSNAFAATGLTSSWIVTATILASTNNVSIVKAVPGTNTLTVTFSGDPGANTTVSWHAISAAV